VRELKPALCSLLRRILRFLAGAVAIAVCSAPFLALGFIALERGCSILIEEEDWSDIQYKSYVYLGRLCRDLAIEASPSLGQAKLTNAGSRPLTNLRVKLKFFAHAGRTVVERQIDRLEPGQTVTYLDTDPDLGVDESIAQDLGMLYVKVRCDQGYGVANGWWSYWD